jgi:hypothetical protein
MRGKGPVPGWSPLIHQLIALSCIWTCNMLMTMLFVLVIFFLLPPFDRTDQRCAFFTDIAAVTSLLTT